MYPEGSPHIGGREIITLFGGEAMVWPLATSGQQPGKLPAVAILATITPSLEA
jgi:hypothetical protein